MGESRADANMDEVIGEGGQGAIAQGSRPYRFLESLRARFPRNTSVDWEALLERGYRAFLGRGQNVVDIGAHGGRHADVFIRDLGAANVVLFEPLVDLAAELRRRYATCGNVEVIGAAVGRELGAAPFVINRHAPSESGLQQRIYNEQGAADLVQSMVQVVTLDSLDVGFEVNYIKIDVEGGELDILRGGRELLARDRPILSVEYGFSSYSVYGYKAEDLYHFAEENGYLVSDLCGNVYDSLDSWLQCVDQYYWDYLMFPVERAPELVDALAELRVGEVPIQGGTGA